MAKELSGLQIFKYLPAAKKLPDSNCKKCGCPTCMAFALKLAKKQVGIEKCPLVPEELKTIFLDAVKVQQHEILIGPSLKTGGENVMFRHDKTFVNKTIFAVSLNTNDPEFENKLNRIKKYRVDRIGETFRVDAIYLTDRGDFLNKAKIVAESDFALILNSNDKEALNELKKLNPVICNSDDKDFTVTVNGKNLEELENNSKNLIEAGNERIILEPDIKNLSVKEVIEELTYIRRLAIQEKYAPLTYPVMIKIPHNENLSKIAALASLLICRYANILVFEDFDEALFTSLLTLRQNIYTNPQKPLQVESKIYEFNDPDRNSPIILTTNFALTYFAVANELESLPFGTYLIVTPSDGMSVLTAWSADKFTADIAAKTIKKFDLENIVDTRSIIIPGLLSHMKEELERALPGWEIIVGTIEACKIPDFIKSITNH